MIGQALKTGDKVGLVADLLRRAESDEDLYRIAVWFSHGPFPPADPRTISVGGALQRQVYAEIVGDESGSTGTLDYDIFVACRTMAGGTIDAVEMLLEARRTTGRPELVRSREMSVEQVQEIYDSLAATRSTSGKLAILVGTWRAMDPTEIAFFHRTADGGSMRIGLSTPLFQQGLALAFGQPLEAIRQVAMIEGDAGRTAIRARNGDLSDTAMSPFAPIDFMLAAAIERRLAEDGSVRFVPDATIDITMYVCEDKLDGVRAQAHIRHLEDGTVRVALYSRNQGELTPGFPDVAERLSHLPHGTVLDGELIGLERDGRVAHFNNLQQRLGVKLPTAKHLANYPAGFVAYDILVEEDQALLDMPLEERRDRLERLAAAYAMPITVQRPLNNWPDVETEFGAARGRGNEGLVLKRLGSRYEYGRRGKAWLKAKKEGGSIDAVIRYATGGSGRRSGTLSDFTFGVWRVEDDGTRRLVNIGRAYGGFTNKELGELNRLLRPLRGQRFGSTYEIEPRIVCELVYDFIQKNSRTEAGYTLRFPRIRRIRWDLGPEDMDTVADVERLYREDLSRTTSETGAIYIPET